MNRSMYHIAKSDINEDDTLKTHVPHHLFKDEGDIPRICVSNNSIKCIVSIHAINNSKIYSKFFTTLFEWINDQKCYEYITFDKMKDLFKEYEIKFPHGNVTFSSFISGFGFAVFRYKNISISEIKLLIKLFKCYCGTIEFIREDEEKVIRFYSVKNVQLLKVMEKSYLPPNASDFRIFGERWVLNDTKNYKILGRIDMAYLFRNHVLRFTNKKYTIIHDLPNTKLCPNSKIKFEI